LTNTRGFLVYRNKNPVLGIREDEKGLNQVGEILTDLRDELKGDLKTPEETPVPLRLDIYAENKFSVNGLAFYSIQQYVYYKYFTFFTTIVEADLKELIEFHDPEKVFTDLGTIYFEQKVDKACRHIIPLRLKKKNVARLLKAVPPFDIEVVGFMGPMVGPIVTYYLRKEKESLSLPQPILLQVSDLLQSSQEIKEWYNLRKLEVLRTVEVILKSNPEVKVSDIIHTLYGESSPCTSKEIVVDQVPIDLGVEVIGWGEEERYALWKYLSISIYLLEKTRGDIPVSVFLKHLFKEIPSSPSSYSKKQIVKTIANLYKKLSALALALPVKDRINVLLGVLSLPPMDIPTTTRKSGDSKTLDMLIRQLGTKEGVRVYSVSKVIHNELKRERLSKQTLSKLYFYS
jgi:hypothetical protein